MYVYFCSTFTTIVHHSHHPSFSPFLYRNSIPNPLSKREMALKHGRANLDGLPDQVLARVISHLPWEERFHAERVSRQWSRVAQSSAAWSDVIRFDSNYHSRLLRGGPVGSTVESKVGQIKCDRHIT